LLQKRGGQHLIMGKTLFLSTQKFFGECNSMQLKYALLERIL
jgi:hypothetical protein